MRESRFIETRRIAQEVTGSIVDTFLNSESCFKQQDIKDFAQQIYDSYRQVENAETHDKVLVDVLSDDKIRTYVMTNLLRQGYDQIDDEVLRGVIRDLRRKVINELRFFFEPEDLYSVQEYFSDKSNKVVADIKDGRGQEMIYRYRIFSKLTPTEMDDYKNGLQQLKDTRGHPNLVRLFDYGQEDSLFWLLVEKRDINSILNELLRGDLSVLGVYQSLLDCMDGACFLEDNGLILEDIAPGNLAYDKDKNCGVLFDIEGVYPCNKKKHVALYKPGMGAPEITTNREHVTSAKEMVYQFGTCLGRFKEIITIKNTKLPELFLAHTEDLVDDMMTPNPEFRPTLKQARDRLSELIKKYL